MWTTLKAVARGIRNRGLDLREGLDGGYRNQELAEDAMIGSQGSNTGQNGATYGG